MELVTFRRRGEPGACVGARVPRGVCDIRAGARVLGMPRLYEASSDMVALLHAGAAVLDDVHRLLETGGSKPDTVTIYPPADTTLLAPILRPGKILCVASNYVEHVKEAKRVELKSKDKTVPWFFLKPATAIVGPDMPIRLPRLSDQVDWEMELAVVIGKAGRDISAADADRHIAGYSIINDVSARSVKMPAAREARNWDQFFDWQYGKWFDTFAPMGPALVTKDAVPDRQNLRIEMRLNGTVRQDGTTRDMIFTVDELIEFISGIVTLEPGDVIATGTPSGVGKAWGIFLAPGDVMESTITGLGTLRTPVGEVL